MRYLLNSFKTIYKRATYIQQYALSTTNSYFTNKYALNLQINNTSLNPYLDVIQHEFKQLNSTNTINKRYSDLQAILQILQDRQQLVENLQTIDDLLLEKDTEIVTLAKDEKSQLLAALNQLETNLLESLFPTEPEDAFDSIVLEVQAGVGGQEAMLFAKEIFDMYTNYCEYKQWQIEIADYLSTDIGGIRYASALINGPLAYRHFKHEAGVHRVQRTPATEKAGRVHTSTASVIILPQPTDIQVKIEAKDLKIETKRSSGAGGQHVNTTDSCVRVTHLPSNITVECQVDRSQIKNRKIAMAKLNALLYQRELDSKNVVEAAARKSQVRAKTRNEKIRTYNYNQDRITDHRLQGSVHNLKVFLEGGEPLDELIRDLDYQYKVDELIHVVNNLNLNK